MEYKVDNAELTATLTAVNLDAAVIGQAPLEVAVGESARIDVGTAINYIKTGTAEIEAAVQEGTAAFDLHANEKRADFNENASNKTATFNQNASNKTAAFNTNAESQFDDYNANASNKLNAYNDNATAQTMAFNENAAIKQAAVDASADAAAASATTAANEANLAEQWAVKMDGKIDNVDYSAKYYAAQAEEAAASVGNPANRDLSNLTATGEAKFTAKQDVISDLSTIRSGAALGATAVQPADLAPYALSANLATVATSGSYNDLSNKPTIPAAQVNSDWNASSGVAQILNKPSIPTDTADLTNGAGYITSSALANYVDKSTNQTIGGVKTFSSTISGSINGNAATVTNGVYTATDQTISGQKTFGKYIQIFNSDSVSGIIGQNTGITKGTAPSTTQEFRFYTHDSGGRLVANRLGGVVNLYQTNGAIRTALQAFKPTANNNTRAEFYVEYPTSGSAYAETTVYLRPSSDNSLNLGYTNYRWKQLYAGTTTIATSDERLKQGVETIPDAVLDAWGEVDFYRYKFNDSVAEKGFDKARYHTGMVAQRIERIFAEHGLNAFDYGLLCFDEWQAEPEVRDEENEIIKPAVAAGDRYSLRYEECLCMEAAYQRRRADRIEKRLNALEARL